jgi:hypothetical protein
MPWKRMLSFIINYRSKEGRDNITIRKDPLKWKIIWIICSKVVRNNLTRWQIYKITYWIKLKFT